MAVYTISPDLLENIDKEDGIYLTDILLVFTQRTNPYKVSKDKNGDVISAYQAIKTNAEHIKVWLDLMSFKPSPFEIIDVDISNIDCEETKFMKVCRETKSQNKLILYSSQSLIKHKCQNSIVYFEDIPIQILDRDQARMEFIPTNGDTIINSQVAKGNSVISDSKNS